MLLHICQLTISPSCNIVATGFLHCCINWKKLSWTLLTQLQPHGKIHNILYTLVVSNTYQVCTITCYWSPFDWGPLLHASAYFCGVVNPDKAAFIQCLWTTFIIRGRTHHCKASCQWSQSVSQCFAKKLTEKSCEYSVTPFRCLVACYEMVRGHRKADIF